MESSPSALLRILLPRTPFILKTALAHTLYLSDTSSKWDLRTELTIKILRHMLGPHSKTTSITKQQRLTTKDPGVKGPVWVSKVRCEVPEEEGESVRQVVHGAIEAMKKEGGLHELEDMAYDEACTLRAVEAEWTGCRPGVGAHEPEPAGLSETDKYEKLLKETSSKVTLLYFHGGAMYLLDPSTYRHITGRLAKQTGGRVYSVRYRLAPQHPFPAALMDALAAYLSLLYPPPGAPHAAVPAEEIVFAGDSAGGLLCTALLQLLLHLRRSPSAAKVGWQGAAREAPLPAGLALTSPWLDITRSLPSLESLAKYDYLPPPASAHTMRYPPCDAWPTHPPRADLYCEASALLHPLVSPLAAKDWRGAPPVFFSLGEEMLRDEDAVLAQRMHGQGVVVRWRLFEAMPHCFGMLLDALPGAGVHFDETAKFCREVVEGKVEKGEGVVVLAKSLERKEVDLGSLTALSDGDVRSAMVRAKERIERKHGDAVAEARPML